MNPGGVSYYLRRHNELKRKKSRWLQLWQLCGEMINQLKQDFTSDSEPGDMLNRDLFDSTAPDACGKMAAALIGMLWPNGAKSMAIQPSKKIKQNDRVKKYFEAANEEIRSEIDNPKAGFILALEEFLFDQGSLGTCGLGTFEGEDSALSYETWGVDEICIDEGFGGKVNTIYREFNWPLRRVIETYGQDALSEKLKKCATDDKKLDDKIKILHVIEPRKLVKKGLLSNKNMAFESLHIEVDAKHAIEESGYPELPVNVGRFYKRRKEAYGRSPGMKGLPDILEINVTKESRIVAIEKALNPPIGIMNDAMLGNQKLDRSANAVNVMKASGKLKGASPIIPLYDGSNVREADKSIEELKESINNHFNLDRLLDFNNETQMTLGEARMRQEIRNGALGSLYTRITNEVMTPTIERSVAILFRKGRLGVIENSIQHRLAVMAGEQPLVIPPEIAKLIEKGEEFYDVKYFSPAAQLLEAQEAQGVIMTLEFAAQAMAVDQQLGDYLDLDEGLQSVARARGAPSTLLRAKEVVEQIRNHRAQVMEQQQQMMQAQQEVALAAEASNVKPAA